MLYDTTVQAPSDPHKLNNGHPYLRLRRYCLFASVALDVDGCNLRNLGTLSIPSHLATLLYLAEQMCNLGLWMNDHDLVIWIPECFGFAFGIQGTCNPIACFPKYLPQLLYARMRLSSDFQCNCGLELACFEVFLISSRYCGVNGILIESFRPDHNLKSRT